MASKDVTSFNTNNLTLRDNKLNILIKGLPVARPSKSSITTITKALEDTLGSNTKVLRGFNNCLSSRLSLVTSSMLS